MNSSICTLFEGHYHFGVASLTNSLYKSGYRGAVYAGYRGSLPPWASGAKKNNEFKWDNSTVYQAADGLKIFFLPLETDYHLTNYKPDFMLNLLEGAASNAENILYFDPDIVIVAPWSFYEEWIDCGITLCEDVNSPLFELHPKRVAWRDYYSKHNIELHYKTPIYVNGGFVGIKRTNMQFLYAWKKIQEVMGIHIGGLSRSALTGEPLPQHLSGDFAPFGKTDQDALNATIEFYDTSYSILGKESMSFARGLAVMRHALGQPKPWQWHPIKQAFVGRPPRAVDKDFWNLVTFPIAAFGSSRISFMKRLVSIAAFIGRFYRRN